MKLSDEDCAVKIAVRERTIRDSYEASPDTNSVITYHNSNILIVDQRPFVFDYALQPNVSQSELFVNLVQPLVLKTLEGFNCTALAYGQTGTGKSYSMGLNAEDCEGENVGIIPRCLEEVFSSDSSCDSKNIIEISVSFIEIYNEKVYDLLGSDSNEQINVKGHKFGGGVKRRILNIEEGYSLLNQGSKNRHVRPTKMNSQSSRSHAIFTIHILQENGVNITSSCLNLVDLAGSEGVRKTGHQGVALTEGVHINQGLLSIGKVLQALTAGNKVIPYRDSVLSSVLQDSLNSNSYLTLLACISPHRKDLSETLSTLRFAQNAKSLRHTPQINSILMKIKKNKEKTPSKKRLINNRLTPGIQKRRPFGLSTNQVLSKKISLMPNNEYHSNTFSTPNKLQKTDVSKLNQSEIGLTPKERLKIGSNRAEIPIFNGFESIMSEKRLTTLHPIAVESKNDSYESRRSSIMSLNISSSTAVEPHATTYSPVVRKCMAEFEDKLESKMQQMLGSLQELKEFNNKSSITVPETPIETPLQSNVVDASNTLNWEFLKTELRSIVREEILTLTEKKYYHSENDENTAKYTRCQLFSDNSEIFKVPEVPKIYNNTFKDSSDASSLIENSFSQDDDVFAQFSNQTVIPQVKRRSCRIRSMCGSERSSSSSECRRSVRLSMKFKDKVASPRTSKRTRFSTRLQSNIETDSNKSAQSTKKTRKGTIASLSNDVIAKYFKETGNQTKTPKKGSKAKHEKAILDMLNTGNIKELQLLPQIGLKTAYQIITHRTLHGKFKNFNQISTLPIWRGKSWERFKTFNNIS